MGNNSKMEIWLECPMCRKEHTVEVERADFLQWKKGRLTQYAFPYLNSTEREQLISRLCPSCQKEIFGC